MATKEQFMNAISKFIENDMLPNASGNYKIILNIAKAAIQHAPAAVFDRVKSNTIISMLGVIDEQNNVNTELLATVLSHGFGSDEFAFTFAAFGKEYTLHFSANDIQTIKRYM